MFGSAGRTERIKEWEQRPGRVFVHQSCDRTGRKKGRDFCVELYYKANGGQWQLVTDLTLSESYKETAFKSSLEVSSDFNKKVSRVSYNFISSVLCQEKYT